MENNEVSFRDLPLHIQLNLLIRHNKSLIEQNQKLIQALKKSNAQTKAFLQHQKLSK